MTVTYGLCGSNMPGKVKVNGAWKDVPEVYTKVNGAWKTVAEAYTKVNGTWQQWFAPGGAMTLVQTITLGSNASQIQFTGLQGLGGKHLLFKGSIRLADRDGPYPTGMGVNGLRGFNYSYVMTGLYDTNNYSQANVSDTEMQIQQASGNNASSVGYNTFDIDMPNFKVTNQSAVFSARQGGALAAVGNIGHAMGFGTYKTIAAINSVEFFPFEGGNLASGSTISLYTLEG